MTSDLTLDASLAEYLDGNEFLSLMGSSPILARMFMQGYLDTAPLEKFPSPYLEDSINSKIRLTAQPVEDILKDLILQEFALSRAYLRGVSLGKSMMFPDQVKDSELSCRTLLVADAVFSNGTIYHLLFNEHVSSFVGEYWLVGTHLRFPRGKCDYCLAGAPNHLGNPFVTPLLYDPKKQIIFNTSS